MGKTVSGYKPAVHCIAGVQGNSWAESFTWKNHDFTGATIRFELRRVPNETPFMVYTNTPVSPEKALVVQVVPATLTIPVHSIVTIPFSSAETREIGQLALFNIDITDSLGFTTTHIVGEMILDAEGYSRA